MPREKMFAKESEKKTQTKISFCLHALLSYPQYFFSLSIFFLRIEEFASGQKVALKKMRSNKVKPLSSILFLKTLIRPLINSPSQNEIVG
jgi:hypothetical protein